jgi:DNA invertase Pin-like site-specific DNA recombinase
MTEVLYNPKIKSEHLARKAIVYLRQSTDKQVRQNKESQLLQYAVAERVRELGWQQVEIINSDLGSSAGLAAEAERLPSRPKDCQPGIQAALSSLPFG